MYTALGLPDGLKHIVELLLAIHQQGHAVVVAEAHTLLAQCLHHYAVSTLTICLGTCQKPNRQK